MRAIGVDTHKATLAACAIDDLGGVLGENEFPNDRPGHLALATWARQMGPDGRLGFEGSSSYGAAAARLLDEAGFDVREVPPHLSKRERVRVRKAGKSDPGDALAIARVTAREEDLPPIRRPDPTIDLGLLLAAREDLVIEATRTRNRLHADLVVLVPGYGGHATNLVAERHLKTVTASLRGLPGIHAELARERLAELRRLQVRARALTRRIVPLVAGHPLLEVTGIGALTAAALLAETGDIRRFRSADAFAMLAGVAPIPASSGQTRRMRLNRGGNRQLNRALHTIALVQAWHHPPAKAFIARKRSEGKTWREALRALTRHLARVVFRLLASPHRLAQQAA
jgi:transposase